MRKTNTIKTNTSTKPVKNEVFNNTSFEMATLVALSLLGNTVNKWRQRNIALYAHPSDPTRLISVGVTFDGSKTLICDETRDDFRVELEYAERGKVYVRE